MLLHHFQEISCQVFHWKNVAAVTISLIWREQTPIGRINMSWDGGFGVTRLCTNTKVSYWCLQSQNTAWAGKNCLVGMFRTHFLKLVCLNLHRELHWTRLSACWSAGEGHFQQILQLYLLLHEIRVIKMNENAIK